jgi:hypothetical protein
VVVGVSVGPWSFGSASRKSGFLRFDNKKQATARTNANTGILRFAQDDGMEGQAQDDDMKGCSSG